MASSTILTARSLSSGGYRCPDPCPDVECFVGGIGFHPPKEWSLHQTQGSSLCPQSGRPRKICELVGQRCANITRRVGKPHSRKVFGGVESVDYRHAGVFPKSTPRDAHCAQLVTNCRYVIRGQNLRIDRGTTREAHGGSWQAERLRGTDLLRMHTNPGEAQQRDVSGQ